MSKAFLSSFSGIAMANTNMVEVFKRNELEQNPNSTLAFSDMVIKKIGIQCDPGTEVLINGNSIPIISGIFELAYGQIDITSLIFKQDVAVNIYFMY